MHDQQDNPLGKKALKKPQPNQNDDPSRRENPPLIMDQSFPVDLEMAGEPLHSQNTAHPQSTKS